MSSRNPAASQEVGRAASHVVRNTSRRQQPIKQRAVAKASLTRMQNFIEADDLKGNEIKVRLDKLPSILRKYKSVQDELQCLDEADYCLDREEFKNQYYQVEANFNELLHPVVEPPLSRHSSLCSSLSGRSNNSPPSHASSTHTSHCISNNSR